jgi:hypothetical protein
MDLVKYNHLGFAISRNFLQKFIQAAGFTVPQASPPSNV